MKTLFDNEHERDENLDSRLFDLARSGNELSSELSAPERREVEHIRDVLKLIDAAWKVTPAEVDRVQALFYAKLAAKHPRHPLLQGNTVETLGELLEASGDEVPELAGPARKALLQDHTPLSQLREPTTRNALLGQAFRAAQVPTGATLALINWLKRSMAELIPLADNSSRLVYTRRQRKPKKPEHTTDAKNNDADS